MAKIVKADEPFERIDEPREKALELCRDLGQQFKVEHINEGLAERGDAYRFIARESSSTSAAARISRRPG